VKRVAAPPSLLDDPFFVAELAKLELPPVTTEVWGGTRWLREPPVAEASDDGEAFEDVEAGIARGPHTVTSAPRFAGPRTAERGVPVGRTLLTVGSLVVMMLVGAAAAVVVFHDRVALILQTLR